MNHKTVIFIGSLVIVILIYLSFYTVAEGYQALSLYLGQLQRNQHTGQVEIKQPGLHFKWPFIEKILSFDTRLQSLNGQALHNLTSDNKDVNVDYYTKWRINNLPLFFMRTEGNEEQVNILLQQQLNEAIHAQFALHPLNEVLADKRAKILQELLNQARVGAEGLGIEVVDVRIKQMEFPSEVRVAIFSRMQAEMERLATQYRSEGKAEADTTRANAEITAALTVATARTEAAKLQGEGDLQASKIYADAYSQDADFYAFYRRIQALYKAYSTKDNILILGPDGQFFNYFNNIAPLKTAGE